MAILNTLFNMIWVHIGVGIACVISVFSSEWSHDMCAGVGVDSDSTTSLVFWVR